MTGGDGGLEIESLASTDANKAKTDRRELVPPSEHELREADRLRAEWATLEREREERAAVAFRQRRWRTRNVIAWIAFRDPKAINLDFMEAMPLRSPDAKSVKKLKPEWMRVGDWKPGNTLLSVLRSGKLIAFGTDGIAIPAMKWELVANNWDRNDYRTWEPLRFEQEDVTKAFPILVTKISPPMDKLFEFVSEFFLAAVAEGRPAGREERKAAAEAHFGGVIPWKLMDEATEKAGIETKGGRPSKPGK